MLWRVNERRITAHAASEAFGYDYSRTTGAGGWQWGDPEILQSDGAEGHNACPGVPWGSLCLHHADTECSTP